jgi:hypothetical protein
MAEGLLDGEPGAAIHAPVGKFETPTTGSWDAQNRWDECHAAWNTYLPEHCLKTMAALGWDRST